MQLFALGVMLGLAVTCHGKYHIALLKRKGTKQEWSLLRATLLPHRCLFVAPNVGHQLRVVNKRISVVLELINRIISVSFKIIYGVLNMPFQ